MKIFTFNTGRKYTCCLISLLAVSLSAALSADASETALIDRIKDTNESFDNRSAPHVPVIEETVLARVKDQRGSFRVLSRKKAIERYKCSSCHTDKQVLVKRGAELTHGNVVLKHGQGEQTLACIDCHHAEERDFLEDKKGRKIDFDHSYQLCGQCHFRQKKDWIGGAHGKRVSNWAGERVIYNCATCHDPHSPRFEKRFPATYSVPLD